MTIKRKASKAHNYVQSDIEEKIEEMINRGGTLTIDASQEKERVEEPEVRFTLRVPASLVKAIDSARKPRAGNISRNQWILETVSRALDWHQDNQKHPNI